MDATRELIRTIGAYFNRDLSETDYRKLGFHVQQYESKLPAVVKVEQKIVTKEIFKVIDENGKELREVELTPALESRLMAVAEAVAQDHGITIEQLKRNSPIYHYENGKRRLKKYIAAREYFIKKAKVTYPSVSLCQIAAFLGYKEHGSISHHFNK